MNTLFIPRDPTLARRYKDFMRRKTPLAQRFENASADARCITQGVQWVRAAYGLTNAQAHAAISAATVAAGKKAGRVQAAFDLSTVLSHLSTAEQKWPGVLNALLTDPYRAIASRYGASNGSIWYVRMRIREAARIMGKDEGAAVRAALAG